MFNILSLLPKKLTIFLPVFLLFSTYVYAYDAGTNPVHQYISQQAQYLWREIPSEITDNLKTNILDKWRLDNEGYSSGEDIIVGSAEEDMERDFTCDWGVVQSIAKNIFQNDIETPFYYHFWNPDIPQGGLYGFGWSAENYNGSIRDFGAWPDFKSFVASHCGTYYFESNYQRAEKLWTFATNLYLRGRIDESFYWIGRIVHLLEDLTVPAHVHDDTHVPTDNDLYEKFTASSCDAYQEGNTFNAQHFKGIDYVGTYYKYDNLPNLPNTVFNEVYPSNPSNLFKLFWYTAQKTQYFASNDANGNDRYFTIDGKEQIFNPSLWNGETNLIINNSSGLSIGLQISCSGQTLDILNSNVDRALIPHAMKAVAGLYQLFWVETHLGFGPDVADSIRTSFLAAYRGPSVMGVPLGYAPDVHRWGNGYIQDFDGGTGGKGALMLRDGTNIAYWVHGAIWSKYESLEGATGWLGYPTSDQYTTDVGHPRSDFVNGYITTTDGVTFQVFSYDSLPVLSPPTLVSPGTSTEPGIDIDTTTPTFNWIAIQGADYYGLYISKYPYGEENTFYVNETIPGDLTSFPLPEGYLSNGEKYRWNMRAHNSAGWSEYQTNKLYFRVNIIQPCNYTLTVNINPPGSGIIIRNPNKNGYCQGEQVSFTASPNAGYNFVFWEGDLNGSMDFVALTMDATKSVTANFRVKLRGDINGDGNVNLQDAILALQAISKMTPSEIRPDYTRSGTDVDGDGKIGLAEVLYVLQIAAELRSAPLQPAISPWPMFQHDAQHTGVIPTFVLPSAK